MLCRLGFQFSGAGDVRHQGKVYKDRLPARQFLPELADRLEERQPLDVADRAADLHQYEIDALVAFQHEVFDRIGHMRDHLHGAAEVIPAPLLGDDVLINPPGGDVILLARRDARETLVVAKIEVGLRPVVGDKHLAVLSGAHGPGIDIEIGIEFAQPHTKAAGLEERPQSCRCQTFAKRGDHAASDENISRHGRRDIHGLGGDSKRGIAERAQAWGWRGVAGGAAINVRHIPSHLSVGTPITIRTSKSCLLHPSTGGIGPPGATGNALICALAGVHELSPAPGVYLAARQRKCVTS